MAVSLTIDTNHEDMIHDAQLDFYGTTLATASSDESIKIFDVRNKRYTLVAHLKEHQGPVWGVSWSHPMYGSLLASCGYDRKVIIWREMNGRWEKLYEYAEHSSSVNCVSWAPHSYGLMLACGSSDGSISILTSDGTNTWHATRLPDAHAVGVNSVSWSPAVNADFMLNPSVTKSVSPIVKRLVSGGSDSLVKIWREDIPSNGVGAEWIEETRLDGHSDWVRDVAWAPTLNVNRQLIASCGQDGRVIVWQSVDPEGPQSGGALVSPREYAYRSCATNWRPIVLTTCNDVVWHLSWSVTGNILAVSGGDNKVTLWKETLDGVWITLSEIARNPDPVNLIGADEPSQMSNYSVPQMAPG